MHMFVLSVFPACLLLLGVSAYLDKTIYTMKVASNEGATFLIWNNFGASMDE